MTLLSIPLPRFDLGERVQAVNKRMDNAYEAGKILGAQFSLYRADLRKDLGTGYWTYNVVLDRRAKTGHMIFLDVRDDEIAEIPPVDY